MTISDKDFKAIENFDIEQVAGNVDATMKAVGAERTKSFLVPIDQIHILPGYNPRIPGPRYQAKLEWLSAQIQEHGFYPDKPLAGFVVVEDGVQATYVQDGQSRLLAARMAVEAGAPLTHLPMIIKDKASSQLDLTIALVTSNEGEAFGPMEKAALVKRFRAFGKSDAEIAVIMRCSAAYVGQLSTLAAAPSKIRNMIVEEEVSATRAIEVIKKHGDKALEVLQAGLSKAKDKGKTKSSAKDDLDAYKKTRQKQLAGDAFNLLITLLESKEVQMPKELADLIDSLVFRSEEAPPAPKEPKPKKVAKAKKEPLASKIAKAAKKKGVVDSETLPLLEEISRPAFEEAPV